MANENKNCAGKYSVYQCRLGGCSAYRLCTNPAKNQPTHKDDLHCTYCGSQDFMEIPNPSHSKDIRYSTWECTKCRAEYENNEGYGYFTSYWGDMGESAPELYSLSTGKLLDDSKLPITPEDRKS